MLIGSTEGSISEMCLQHEHTNVNYRFVKKLMTMIKVCLDYSSKTSILILSGILNIHSTYKAERHVHCTKFKQDEN